MRNHIGKTVSSVLVATALSACGDVGSDEEKSAPPPVMPGQSETLFSLQNGTYFVRDITELQDGCNRQPLAASGPLTQEKFDLKNDGNGTVSINFCGYGGSILGGTVRGNSGTLSVNHPSRHVSADPNMRNAGTFDQECRIDLKMVGDNKFAGHFVELQRNRDKAYQLLTERAVADCTTTFNFTMERKKDL